MMAVTETAAVIAGLAILASPFVLTGNRSVSSLAAVGLSIVAAVIIHGIA